MKAAPNLSRLISCWNHATRSDSFHIGKLYRYYCGEDCVKLLKKDSELTFELLGEKHPFKITAELKTVNSDDRLLLFSVTSDENNVILMVAGVYAKKGLHKPSHARKLFASEASQAAFAIEFPKKSNQELKPIPT